MAKMSPDEEKVVQQGEAFMYMMRLEGWALLEELIQQRAGAAMQEILSSSGVEGVLQVERLKGTVNALQMVLSLPHATVQQMQEIVAEHGPQEEDDE